MMRNIIQYELSRDDDNFFYLFLQLYRITSRNVSRDGSHIPKGNILLAHTPHFEFRSQFFLLSFFFFSNFHFRFLCPLEVNQFQKKPSQLFFVPCKISRDCVAAHTSFIPIWNGTSEYRKRDQFWNRKKTDKTKANSGDSQYSILDLFPKVCNSIVKVDIREVESEATDRST